MSAESAEKPAHPLRSWIGVAVVLLLSILAAAGVKSYRDLDAVRSHEAGLEQRVQAAKERIAELDQRLERIENDPITLERLAREELGMVRPDDIVIVLPESDAASRASDPGPETDNDTI